MQKINIAEAEKYLKIDEDVKEAFEAWFENIFISDGNLLKTMEKIIRNESAKDPKIFYTVLVTAFDFDVTILSHFKDEMTDKISTQLWQEIGRRDDLYEFASDFLNSISQTTISKNFVELVVKPFINQSNGKSQNNRTDIQNLLAEEIPKFAERHRHFQRCKEDKEHLLQVINKTHRTNKNQENSDISKNRTFKL